MTNVLFIVYFIPWLCQDTAEELTLGGFGPEKA